MKSLPWQIGSLNIPFHLGHDCAPAIATQLARFPADLLFLIADSTMWPHHRARYQSAFTQLPNLHIIPWTCSESDKSLSSIDALAQRLLNENITRRSILIPAGGGVLGNLVGTTAALLFRGIRFIHLPTTLLAMHDSVTSLKQAVNCAGIKNILGSFHTPTAIFVDTAFLTTLPPDHLRAGLTELIKNALILGGTYANNLAENLIQQKSPAVWQGLIESGIAAKSELMRDDPHERHRALALEYGHTIGHALELAHHGQLNHGDSIAWGMHCAAWISHDLGYMSNSAKAAHEQWLSLLGPLPKPTTPAPLEEILRRVLRDNKRGYLPHNNNTIAMVLLCQPGVVAVTDGSLPLTCVPELAIIKALNLLREQWQCLSH